MDKQRATDLLTSVDILVHGARAAVDQNRPDEACDEATRAIATLTRFRETTRLARLLRRMRGDANE